MKKMLRILKESKGFTLVELIVVIAIIGILVAIAVPKLTGFTDSAKETNDKQLEKILKNTTTVLIANGTIVVDAAAASKFVVTNDTATSGLLYTCSTDAPKTGVTTTSRYDTAGLKVVMAKFIEDTAKISQTGKKITVTIETDGDVITKIETA